MASFTLKYNLNAKGQRRDTHTYIAFPAVETKFKKFIEDICGREIFLAKAHRIPWRTEDIVAVIAKRFPKWNVIDERVENIENEPPKYECMCSDAGILLKERWMFDGKFHRTDGPAQRSFDDEGNVTEEYWFLHGKVHRTDGPAITTWNPDANVEGDERQERWMTNGVTHRTDGPAITTWDPETEERREQWVSNGTSHRIGGPADCEWISGVLVKELWNVQRKTDTPYTYVFHRTDGPAFSLWDEEGNPITERWYTNGHFHRTDGPAIQDWSTDRLLSPEWWMDGVKMTHQAFVLQSGRRKVLRVARLLALETEVPKLSHDNLAAIGKFL
uniref:Uncharacterized protein n=1 Tax=viral metagenome TaxID=1070528 RepID=A0A6C0KD36_9ZZZZ